jgi:outer membrane protein OmpA-like peptidoglycan-associated protein
MPENDPVLQNAHLAVSAAQNNPQVTTYAAAEASQAVATMRAADDAAMRLGGADDARKLALLASQQAAQAQQVAQMRNQQAVLAVQRTAQDAQAQAEASRRLADSAQLQAAAAQRQADDVQRQASAMQLQALNQAQGNVVMGDQSQLAEIPARPSLRGPVVTVSDEMFDPGSAQLRPDASYTVQRLGRFLVMHPERTVAIEGFSDSSGDAYYDRRLAEQRAAAVQAALVGAGVAPSRMVVRSYGQDYPVASNGNVEGRRLNRRVEVVVSERANMVPPRG